MPARGTERWLSQRLSHRLGPGGQAARRRLRRRRVPLAPLPGRRADRHRRRRPVGARRPGLAGARACSTPSLDEPWARTLAGHLGHCTRGEEAEFRRGRRYAVARRVAGLLRLLRRAAPRAAGRLERRRRTGDGAGGELARRPGLAAAAVAGRGRAVDAPTPPSGTPPPWPGCVGARAHLPARLSLFGHTRMPAHRGRAARARWPTHHELHLWLPHPSDALWRGLAGAHPPGTPGDARAAPRGPRPRRGRGTRCWPRLGRDVRELRSALLRRRRCTASHRRGAQSPDGSRGPRRPCSAGCSPTCAPTRSARPVATTTPPTAACRCTPATVPPGRSRCCARCCSACWPTTPRWSRATSW